MLNFRNPSIMNNDCYCCGTIRRHPKPNWHGCLNFKKPSCPKMNVPSHNVLAPSNAQHSKRMRNVQQLKSASRNRWKKVNWRRFQLQRQTKEYQTRVITNSTNNEYKIVIRNGYVKQTNPPTNPLDTKSLQIEPNCKNTLDITPGDIANMSREEVDSYFGGPKTGCKYYRFPDTTEPINIIHNVKGQSCNKIQQWEPR